MKTNKQYVNKKVSHLCWIILFSAITHFLFQIASFGGCTYSIRTWLINIFLYSLLYTFLICVTNNSKVGAIIQSSVVFVLGVIESYIITYRGFAPTFSDLLSIRTFFMVSESYDYIPSIMQIFQFLVCIGFILWLIVFYSPKRKSHILNPFTINELISFKNNRLIFGSCSLFLSVFYACIFLFFTPPFYHESIFDTTYEIVSNGNAPAFIHSAKSMFIQESDNYDKSEVINTLSLIHDDNAIDVMPHVIVVMCEAFSDPEILGDFKTNAPYIPYLSSIHSDSEDTVSGYLNVSVIGGNTVNTSFEYLTGLSMRNLPAGSVPFQQYMNDYSNYSFALPEYMKKIGYHTTYMIPSKSYGYKQNIASKILGFDQSIFYEQLEDAEIVRNYVSDDYFLKQVIRQYEATLKDNHKSFIYATTTQNHGMYSGDDIRHFDEYFKPLYNAYNFSESELIEHVSYNGSIAVIGNYDENTSYDSLNAYLSLQQLTDMAMESFIEYFDSVDEPVVIVFFGDHQPSKMVTEVIADDNIEEYEYYRVPFFIHANFDIKEQRDIEISANYLSNLVSDVCGLPKSSMQKYVETIRDAYPVYSTQRLIENESRQDLIDEYNNVQYYLMFDQ